VTDAVEVLLAQDASADWASLKAAVALGVQPHALRSNAVDVSPVKLKRAGAHHVAMVDNHMQILAGCAACSVIIAAVARAAGAAGAVAAADAGGFISCA